MCAFGQHFLAFVKAVVDEVLAVDEAELLESLKRFEPLLLIFVNGVAVDGEGGDVEFEGVRGLEMLHFEEFVFREEVVLHDVSHAQAGAGNLVGIGRAYAFQSGADFGIAFGLLVGGVEQTVGGQNEVCLFRDIEVFGGIDAFFLQCFDFLFEDAGLYEHAIANQVYLVFMENA